VFVSVAFASLIYFSFLVLKETVIVLGEIELKSVEVGCTPRTLPEVCMIVSLHSEKFGFL